MPILFWCHFTVLALAIVPAISVAVRTFGRFIRELSNKTQAAAALASSIAEVKSDSVYSEIQSSDLDQSVLDKNLGLTKQESFGAVRTVRSFAKEGFECSRYGEKVEECLKLGIRQAVCLFKVYRFDFFKARNCILSDLFCNSLW